jgi:hypothetical protein
VLVSGGLSSLQLNQAGSLLTTNPNAYFTAANQAELYLQASAVYNTSANDRFYIQSGAMLTGTAAALASLSRVPSLAAMTAAGNVYPEPGAIISQAAVPQSDIMASGQMISNLGTAADLWYAPPSTIGTLPSTVTDHGTLLTTVTVGNGTPWKGISAGNRSAGSQLTGGTITANSDFYLQGPVRDGAYAPLMLGSQNTSLSALTPTARA